MWTRDGKGKAGGGVGVVGEFGRWRGIKRRRERSLFLPTTKAVRGNNKHGEWCVSREALSRVSVRTGQREGHRREWMEKREWPMMENRAIGEMTMGEEGRR